ncbi:Hypothetical protein PHPALM_38200 [Phytophthora palmivora]|uniref:Uncharacterized protein n=1 Tax=Phytophthora palmivora TaxID=4796 RepID=A0A2P4WVH8_9STRA|nr:Hypothetical protein PHPALM_38200 [Phytophthora palmivora]
MNDVFDAETGEKLELFVPSRIETESCKAALVPTSEIQQSTPTRAVHRETQSQRVLGDYVDWERQQKTEKRFRESLAGIRQELQRHGLSEVDHLSLTTELLEKTKHGYARHIQTLVVEELAREIGREVAMRLELASLGRERMQRRHDKERAFYRAQIARIHEECEMALTAAAAKNNLLR